MYKNHLYYDSNPNGKFFCQIFNDLRYDEDQKLKLGHEYEIYLNEKHIGTAKIVGQKEVKFQYLSDMLTRLTAGEELALYVAKLKAQYPRTEFLFTTPLNHIVLEWQVRNLNQQSEFLHAWWTDTHQAHAQIQKLYGKTNVYKLGTP